jgi:hypothetical protein
MVGLNGSSLLARCRVAVRGAGVSRYLASVRAADMQMPGDLARRPVLGPVQAMNGIDLVRGQHLSDARYNGKLVGSP